MTDMTALFSARTTNGSSDPVKVAALRDSNGSWPQVGEHLAVFADGTFDGATIALEVAPTSAGPWASTADSAFTAAGRVVTPMSGRAWVRATVSSAGASTSVSLWVG